MGVYDTLVMPDTPADGEQVKCWHRRMHSIRVGDKVAPITTVDVQGSFPDEEYKETDHRDYVIVMRCGGFLVVRDCTLQGYFGEGEYMPGDPPPGLFPKFDKWGEPWEGSERNHGIMGEPYFYKHAALGRSVNALARARPPRDPDHDTRRR